MRVFRRWAELPGVSSASSSSSRTGGSGRPGRKSPMFLRKPARVSRRLSPYSYPRIRRARHARSSPGRLCTWMPPAWRKSSPGRIARFRRCFPIRVPQPMRAARPRMLSTVCSSGCSGAREKPTLAGGCSHEPSSPGFWGGAGGPADWRALAAAAARQVPRCCIIAGARAVRGVSGRHAHAEHAPDPARGGHNHPTRPVTDLIRGTGPSVLAGRTGMGKSTAAELLRREGARQGRAVLVAHAEANLPGRLSALAADAISEVLREDLPAATGRQALADRDVTLVTDGVSEVPDEIRRALGEEFRAPEAAGNGARIILLGRDMAAVRSVLPSSAATASRGIPSTMIATKTRRCRSLSTSVRARRSASASSRDSACCAGSAPNRSGMRSHASSPTCTGALRQ